MDVVTPVLPFPPISWWCKMANATEVMYDTHEHFEKMSLRNRYRISGANNPILLSIPLENGRSQRSTMRDVKVSNRENWQIRHWRTLLSVYGRAPYWEYYCHHLQPIFQQQYTYLIDFNLDGIELLYNLLKMEWMHRFAESYQKQYAPSVVDLRQGDATQDGVNNFPHYYQVFEDRIGFQPDLSILDLLFSEGRNTANWLKQHKDL